MTRISGVTPEGRKVVQGLWFLYETFGLPLDVLLDAMLARGMIPDWRDFVAAAEKSGMKRERILSKLEPAVLDTYGLAMWKAIEARL